MTKEEIEQYLKDLEEHLARKEAVAARAKR